MISSEPIGARSVIRVREQEANSVLQFMTSIYGPHELNIHERNSVKFGYVGNARAMADTSFGYLEYGSTVTVSLGKEIDHYTVCLPIQGSHTLFDSGIPDLSNKALVLSPGREASINMDSQWRSVFVTFNRRILEFELARLLGQPVRTPLVFQTAMQTDTPETSSWWRAVKYYIKEMREKSSIVSHPCVGSEIERNLIRALLLAHRSNYSDRIENNSIYSLPNYLRMAKEFIEDNFHDDICLDMIRISAGVNMAKLCSGFKEFTGTTPMGYLKRVRLERAREELMKGDPRKNVSTVALDAGFNHLGRFSVEYKAAYNESPSETASRYTIKNNMR